VLLLESFPYAKESFVALLENVIKNYSFSANIKIILYNIGIQYGATDITSIDEALSSAVKTLNKYTQNVQIMSSEDNGAKKNAVASNLNFQYKAQKKQQVKEALEIFESCYEIDYMNDFQRFLVGNDEKDNGILSEQTFGAAAKFELIKGSDDIEKRILLNYVNIVKSNRDILIRMIENLYQTYLYCFVKISGDYSQKIVDMLIYELENCYSFRSKTACPQTNIEYRRLCVDNGYIISLKQHVNDAIDRHIKERLREDIHNKLKECEVKYS
jgi:hypothetical protein